MILSRNKYSVNQNTIVWFRAIKKKIKKKSTGFIILWMLFSNNIKIVRQYTHSVMVAYLTFYRFNTWKDKTTNNELYISTPRLRLKNLHFQRTNFYNLQAVGTYWFMQSSIHRLLWESEVKFVLKSLKYWFYQIL